jgi:hypothetical protein
VKALANSSATTTNVARRGKPLIFQEGALHSSNPWVRDADSARGDSAARLTFGCNTAQGEIGDLCLPFRSVVRRSERHVSGPIYPERQCSTRVGRIASKAWLGAQQLPLSARVREISP